ncbi:MAG TPA: hypothetical protein VK470_08115 [Bacteroidota bacterium]|nr:hypothetical protein [Bacteroidota bacterium]
MADIRIAISIKINSSIPMLFMVVLLSTKSPYMKLSALFSVLFIVNISVHSQPLVIPYSRHDIQTIQGHRILDHSIIVPPDFINRAKNNFWKRESPPPDTLFKWQHLAGPNGSAVRCFARARNGAIFACSEGGIYRSSAFGAVWEQLSLPASSYYWALSSLFIHPNGTIIACGTAQVFRSTDNGNTWTVFDTGANMEGVAMDSSGNLYGASYDGGLFFSNDTGRNWTSIGLQTKI